MRAQECLSFIVPAWYIVLSEAMRDIFLHSIHKNVTVHFVRLVGVDGGGCWEVLDCGVDTVGNVSPGGLAKVSALVFPWSARPMMV